MFQKFADMSNRPAGNRDVARQENTDLEEHICEVWAHNLEEEMNRIRDIVEKYPYIAMVRTFYLHR